ncbi:MAG: CHASE2 domain-containing protein [Verrucomicrobia bacterium]|nr:CHASE2 domain-containing protein [Verrucomicrobiota bacterium]
MARTAKKDALVRRLILAGICAGTALFFGLLALIQFKPLLEAEYYTRDLRIRFGQTAPISPEIVFLAIDKQSYKDVLMEEEVAAHPALAEMSTGSWPWRRSVWGHVIRRVAEAGAKVVALDLMFPTAKEGDDELLQALDEFGSRAVTGGTFEEVSNLGRTSVQLALPAMLAANGVTEIASDNPNGRVGYVNLWPDEDGIIRRAHYRRVFQDTSAISLTGRMLEKAGLGARIPEGASALMRYAGPPNFNYKAIPIYQLFVPSTWEKVFQNGEMLKDKLVLVGPYGNWSKDVLKTPYPNPMPGPEVHLAALGAALTGSFLQLPPAWTSPALLAAGALLALLLILATSQPVLRLGLLLLAALGYAVLTFFIQDRMNLILPAVNPALTLLLGGIGCLSYEFVLEQREKRRVRGMFSTMVSPEVLAYMQADPDRFRLTGEKKMVRPGRLHDDLGIRHGRGSRQDPEPLPHSDEQPGDQIRRLYRQIRRRCHYGRLRCPRVARPGSRLPRLESLLVGPGAAGTAADPQAGAQGRVRLRHRRPHGHQHRGGGGRQHGVRTEIPVHGDGRCREPSRPL